MASIRSWVLLGNVGRYSNTYIRSLIMLIFEAIIGFVVFIHLVHLVDEITR
jgi:hypothetical protein